MALSNEKKCRIEDAIKEGYTLEVIAKNYNVSKRTVANVKKELVQTDPQLADIINDNKYNLKQSNRQAEREEHIKKLKELYEDTEEGWIFDAAVEDSISKQTSRTFAGIVYELTDETRQELALQLESRGYSGELSPIHDKDVWEHDSPQEINLETGEIIKETGSRYKSGDRKKPHTHIMIQIDHSIQNNTFNKIIHSILTDTPRWITIFSVKGYHNYMMHRTEASIKAGKYQYDQDEIITFGNFEMIMTKADKQLLITAFAAEIVENNICYMSELVKRHNHIPEEIGVIKECSYFLKSLIDEQWRKLNPEGRISRTKVEIVQDLEKDER